MSRCLVLAALAAGLGLPAVPAVAGGGVAVTIGSHWGHRHHGHRWGPRVGVAIGLGAPLYYGSYGYAPYYYGPYYDGGGTLLVAPPPVVYESGPVPMAPAAPPMARPDPIFYPSKGQSTAQTEADRRDCNRWAIGQNGAMADAEVFHRATLACMEGKGYTVR